MKRTSLRALALLVAPLAAALPAGDAKTDYRGLEKEYRMAMEGFEAELATLKEEGNEPAVAAYQANWDPTLAFVDDFGAKAAEYADTDDAVRFLVWVVRNDLMPEGARELPQPAATALATLIESHAANEEFARYVEQAGRGAEYLGKARCLSVLEAVIAQAPNDELKLQATFGRGVACMGESSTADERAHARKDLLAAQAGCEEGSDLAEAVTGYLFELDNLQIGMIAPDIVAADLDGVEFKLSDYRGKIVMLDFWGDW